MQACLCSRQRSPSFAGQSYCQVAQQLSAKTCDLGAELAACKTLAKRAASGGASERCRQLKRSTGEAGSPTHRNEQLQLQCRLPKRLTGRLPYLPGYAS